MKKIVIFKFLLVAFIHTTTGNISFGQYKGPGSADKTDRIYSVKEIKDDASRLDRSDILVKVKGYIIMQISKDTYEFKDATGTLQVEIDKKKLPAKPFDDKTELIIIGEVDYDLLEPVELEAEQVLIVGM